MAIFLLNSEGNVDTVIIPVLAPVRVEFRPAIIPGTSYFLLFSGGGGDIIKLIEVQAL
jgi:hypothetical protein